MADGGDEFWERLLRAAPYHETIERLRDAIDEPGWRQREAAKALAAKRSGEAPRTIPATLGTVNSRSYRQVNVKLSEGDFEVLRGLAVASDVAASTMARMLLRRALLAEAGDGRA